MSGSVIKVEFDVLALLQTKREITIENFRNLGKLIVPKGSRVIVKTDVSKTGGTWILADVFIGHDAVFYGICIEADDVEPIASSPARVK